MGLLARSGSIATFILLASFVPSGWNVPVASAQRGSHALRAEGGLGLSLRDGDDRDDLGGGFGVGYEYRFVSALGVEGRFSGYYFPFDTGEFQGSGLATYYAAAAGLRAHLAPKWERGDLWLGAAGAYVRTGDLSRAGLEAGLGLDFYVTPSFGIGPFVRYAHVFQPDDSVIGPQDGRLLLVGAALTWAPTRNRETESESESEPDSESGTDADPDSSYTDPDSSDPDPDSSDPDPDSSDPDPDSSDPDPDSSDPDPDSERGRVVSLQTTIRFGFQSSDISPESEDDLREIAETLRRERGVRRVLVVGHADRLGDSQYNQRISEERARNVARWLRRHGVGRVRFTVRGAGDSEPVVQGDTPEALAPNRRVEFEIAEPPGGVVGD